MLPSWRAVVAVGALVAVGASASGQPVSAKVKFEVSADGGTTWGSTATVQAGDPYRVRAVASWVNGAQPAYGLAIITLNEMRFLGATTSEFTGFDDLYKFFPPTMTENWTLYDITGGVKIDNVTSPTAYRLNFGQLPEETPLGTRPDFVHDNPIRIFEIEMTSRAEAYDVTIEADYLKTGTPARNVFEIFMGERSQPRLKPTQEATLESAHVTVVPGPGAGTIAMAGLGLLRRRRPSGC